MTTVKDTLERIKNEVANKHEYKDFAEIFPEQQEREHYSAIINEIATGYASACIEASLNRVLENIEFTEVLHPPNNDREIVVRKESVLSKDNHCIL